MLAMPSSVDDPSPSDHPWCVVTGGRGFAARHLVLMLLRSPNRWRVRIADLGPAIKLDPGEESGFLGDALRSARAVYVSADLRKNLTSSKEFRQIKIYFSFQYLMASCQGMYLFLMDGAFEGAEVVFHMAAPDSSINNYQLHHSVNIEGTRNVINGCVECKVKRLIYTSSPSVIFDGIHGIHSAMESMPYPKQFNDSYSETKAEGERMVMKANGRGGLLTCCIRPSSIFGPGDKLLVPSLASAAKDGKSRYIIGDGNNLYDFTYVENVAYGHICAERTLAAGGPHAVKAAGQAFFITNNEPIKFWEFMSLILEGLGYQRPSITIPVSVMMPLARLVELTYKYFSRYGMRVPQLTPSRVRLLSCTRTFSCARARIYLDYEPKVSLKDGLKRTIDSYPHLGAEKQCKTSKASIILGSGNISNMILWRDKKQTLTALLLLVVFYCHLFAMGYTFITSMAKLLSLAAVFLLVHGTLPAKILGKPQPSFFHLSKCTVHHIAHLITSVWNTAICIVRSLCKGKDWSLYLKVMTVLLFINTLAVMSAKTQYKLGVSFIFVAFVAYEKWEDQIDEIPNLAFTYILKLKCVALQKLKALHTELLSL